MENEKKKTETTGYGDAFLPPLRRARKEGNEKKKKRGNFNFESQIFPN